MDVVLLNPKPGEKKGTNIEPPLGLAYIASLLEHNGFECMIVDASVMRLSNKEITEKIPEDTKMIGMYLNSFSFNSVQSLAKLIRHMRKNSLILIGGPLPSVVPELVLKEITCDGVIRGEGEYSILNIMNNIRGNKFSFEGKISGLTYFDTSNGLVSNPVLRIENLDDLPFPAYHLLPPLNLYKSRSRKKPVAAIITSRGCAFGCSFCSKDIFKKKAVFRSADNVLHEIDYMVKEYGVKQIDILDDNFAQNVKRLKSILSGLIERNYDLELSLQSGIRTELLDEDILTMMKKAGIYKLAFGIESADEEVLMFHNKRLDLNKVINTVTISKKMGFVVYGYFMIGLPRETEEGFNKTIAFAKKLDFDVANFSMAIPFIGTELYRIVKKEGRFLIDTSRNIDAGFYDGKVFFVYDNYKEEDIIRRYRTAYKEFYSLKKRLKMLSKIKSIHELLWLISSFLFILKGILKSKLFPIKIRMHDK